MDTFSLLKPVFYVGFLLGLCPYSVHKQQLFVPASLYSLTLIYIVWQSCAKIASMVISDVVTDLYAFGYLLPLQISLNSLISFISLITVLYRYQMWLEIFRGFKQIEIAKIVFQSDVSYSASVAIQTIGIIFLPIPILVYYISFYFKMLEFSWIVAFGQSLATAVNIILLIEFLTYVTIIRSNFSSLNKALINHKTETLPNDLLWQFQTVNDDFPIFVNSACEMHRNLCSLSKLVNDAFGCQLLASVSKAIILITIILYTISLTFIGKADTNGNSVIYLVAMCTVLAHNTLELLVLVFICSSVSNQANHTSVVVHKLMNTDLSDGSREQLQLFSYQLLHQKVSFSVCGFFNLDFTLLNGVIASVATYLVILIQFQM